VPVGLLNVLNSVTSGDNPRILRDEVQGVLELLQFYGLNQRQVLVTINAALTEGTPLSQVLPNSWCVLFGVEIQIIKTATLTALRGSISLSRAAQGAAIAVKSEDLGPFGATETGTARMAYQCPYPLLMPPLSTVISRADIIGTDANVNATLSVEVGVLG